MTTYNLSNLITRELRRRGIKPCRVKFSKRYLRNLHANYPLVEMLEYHYCCRGETHNCWLDVEGVGYGWLWIDHDEEEMPDVLFRSFLNISKSYGRQIFKRKAFVIDRPNEIHYILPMRDIDRTDYVLTFAKNDKYSAIFG